MNPRIDRIPFGRTGHDSSRIIFGAAALWQVSQSEADRALDLLLEHGVNHIDTAASYGDSELRVGPWMDRHRQDFFLASKTELRSYGEARDQIRRSQDRLRVDQLDLIQLHYLVDENEWQTAMGPGGALEAAIEARDEGLVRFIGVTGHDVPVAAMHQRSLERFDFDSVLLPYSYTMMQNPVYAADFETLHAVCRQRSVAVQTIKSLTRRPWGDRPHTHTVWYQPLETQPDIDLAVHYVLSRPGIFLNSAGDLSLLPMVLDAAARFEAVADEEQMAAQVASLAMEPLFK